MDVDRARKDVRIPLVQPDAGKRDTGVVHQDVEFGLRLCHRVDLRHVFHIQLQVTVAGEIRVVVGRRGARSGDRHLRARLAVGGRDAGADATGASGDEHVRAAIVEAREVLDRLTHVLSLF